MSECVKYITAGISKNCKTQGQKGVERTGWIADYTVYGGEDELLALAQGAIRVLSGEEKAMEY